MQAHAYAWEPVRQAIMMILIWCWTKRELLQCGMVQEARWSMGKCPHRAGEFRSVQQVSFECLESHLL